jgi:UDP-N-acetylmuramoyl-tripeptide--D-alanyl-D-alanine ligase
MATAIPENRAPFTVDEIALATGGRVVRHGPATRGVCTDSRAVTEGSAFVALIGDNFDGHAFLEGAVAHGARTLVVSTDEAAAGDVAKSEAKGSAAVRVADTRVALGDLARAHRVRWGGRTHALGPRSLVAITGSAGKTTTKTVLAQMLGAAKNGAVHATVGNLNNDVGVPMTLFGLEDSHRYAVIEVGTNARGEIERLAKVVRPDVAVLTLVAAAHTEGLGTVDDVAVEKGALLAALPASGLCVVNADDARAVLQLSRSPARQSRTYGFSRAADYRITARHSRGLLNSSSVSEGLSTSLAIERSGARIEARSPLLGDAGALAVAASLAVAEWVLNRPLDQAELESALADLSAGGEGRLCPIALADGTLLIDDSYNANPASMRSSVLTAAELALYEGRRLILVLGEMRELGGLSPSEHEALGQMVAEQDVAHVFAVGGDAAHISRVATSRGKSATFAATAEQVVDAVLSSVVAGDVVLVKGSRGVATEKIVRALVEHRGKAEAPAEHPKGWTGGRS